MVLIEHMDLSLHNLGRLSDWKFEKFEIGSCDHGSGSAVRSPSRTRAATVMGRRARCVASATSSRVSREGHKFILTRALNRKSESDGGDDDYPRTFSERAGFYHTLISRALK